MKDHLAELVRGSASPLQARNTVREYLQARILETLQRAGAMIPLAFHGGTALRFLFATSRYSEDLDFALLFAGKLHAILQRPYTKGRDLYDLLWYLSDPGWPPPNLTLLNNALQQTNWSGPHLTSGNWRTAIGDRLRHLEWQRVAQDVHPLLEPGAWTEMLTLENLERALARSS